MSLIANKSLDEKNRFRLLFPCFLTVKIHSITVLLRMIDMISVIRDDPIACLKKIFSISRGFARSRIARTIAILFLN